MAQVKPFARALSPIGDVVLSAIRRLEDSILESSTAKSVKATSITLKATQTGKGYELIAQYTISSDDSAPRTLWLDYRDTPLRLLRLTSSVLAAGSIETGELSRQRVIPLKAKGSETWAGANLEIALQWDPGSSPGYPACMVFPDMLPSIARPMCRPPAHDRIGRPSIIVQKNTDSLLLAGIAGRNETVQFGNELIQAILVPEACVSGDATGPVLFTEGLGQSLLPGERSRIERLCGRILDFLAMDLRQRAEVRIVAKSNHEPLTTRMPDIGTCLSFSRDDFGFGARNGEPSDVYVAGQLSRVFWGGACRIYGRGSNEIEGAINLALALRWLTHIADEGKREKVFRQIRRLASESWISDWVAGLRGHIRQKRAASLGQALYDLLSEDAGALQELRLVTEATWGYGICAEAIKTRLLRHV